MQILKFIEQHLFLFYTVPLFVWISYYYLNGQYDECLADRAKLPPVHGIPLTEPQVTTFLISLIIIIVTSFRFNQNKIQFVPSHAIIALNAFLFHRFIYYIIGVLKTFLGDKKCSLNEYKFNGISGHYFTMIYFFSVFTYYVSLTTMKTKCTKFFSTDIPHISSEHGIGPLSKKYSLYYQHQSKHVIISKLLLLAYCISSYLCLRNTLYKGYHTPHQIMLGIIAGIFSVVLFDFFCLIPFYFQSLFLCVMLPASFYVFCYFREYPFHLNLYIFASGIAVLMTASHWRSKEKYEEEMEKEKQKEE
ncbi:Uncharacterized protein QTN25_009844 [Entamoeba marina]